MNQQRRVRIVRGTPRNWLPETRIHLIAIIGTPVVLKSTAAQRKREYDSIGNPAYSIAAYSPTGASDAFRAWPTLLRPTLLVGLGA